MIEEHGEVQVVLDGNIIIATLVGAFNESGAINYTNQVKKLVNELDGRKYGMLVDNTYTDGGTPEAYSVLEKYHQWQNSTNLAAKALVIKVQLINDLLEYLSPSIKKQTTKTFSDKAEALAWLKESLSALS